MAVTNLSASKLNKLIAQLKVDFTEVKFIKGKTHSWSPGQSIVFYNPESSDRNALVGILHELAHALLGHKNYATDFELLRMESDAWSKAAQLGKTYGVSISDGHIQKCLDTYRDWLYKRSLCPACCSQALQSDPTTYRCFNCQTAWKVTPSRFNRPYRRLKDQNK